MADRSLAGWQNLGDTRMIEATSEETDYGAGR
jgi:hypothetical protein